MHYILTLGLLVWCSSMYKVITKNLKIKIQSLGWKRLQPATAGTCWCTPGDDLDCFIWKLRGGVIFRANNLPCFSIQLSEYLKICWTILDMSAKYTDLRQLSEISRNDWILWQFRRKKSNILRTDANNCNFWVWSGTKTCHCCRSWENAAK